ncbi:MAG: glycosyltransferase family 4 protein, partial [Acidobacteriia bacterium]|nr:glycosyltransferase family 4 protein [Terriglobia bacterium]
RIGPRRVLRMMQQLLAFHREIRRFEPQVIHVHAPGGRTALAKASLFLLASRWRRVPTVFHLHFLADDLCLLNMKWTERLMMRVIAQADVIVPVSEQIGIHLRRHLPATKPIEVMHNCIDLAHWCSLEKTSSSTNSIRLLFLGTMIGERKGQLDLVRALAQSNVPSEVKLIFIGGDRGTGALNRVQALARSLDLAECCQFLGPVYGEQKDQIVVDSDIFVLPSYAEGQPVAILEAMAAGLPIIASRVGAIPDVVRHDENGILFEPGDIPALSKAIERLVYDAQLRREMGERSRQLAHQYDVGPYVERLVQLYESAAKTT